MRRRASLCGGPTPPCRPLAGTLQSLLHSPPAWHYLASQQHRRKGGCGGGFCMHCELERLAEQYSGGARYFAPRALVQSATMIARCIIALCYCVVNACSSRELCSMRIALNRCGAARRSRED